MSLLPWPHRRHFVYENRVESRTHTMDTYYYRNAHWGKKKKTLKYHLQRAVKRRVFLRPVKIDRTEHNLSSVPLHATILKKKKNKINKKCSRQLPQNVSSPSPRSFCVPARVSPLSFRTPPPLLRPPRPCRNRAHPPLPRFSRKPNSERNYIFSSFFPFPRATTTSTTTQRSGDDVDF